LGHKAYVNNNRVKTPFYGTGTLKTIEDQGDWLVEMVNIWL